MLDTPTAILLVEAYTRAVIRFHSICSEPDPAREVVLEAVRGYDHAYDDLLTELTRTHDS